MEFFYLGLLLSDGVLAIVFVIAGYLAWEKKGRLPVQLGVALALTVAIVHIIKSLFPTLRPYAVWGLPQPTPVNPWESFPSGHAAYAFVIAATIWLTDDKFGKLLLFLAMLVGLGRVILMVHFPIDVMVGALIGSIVAYLVYRISVSKS